MSRGPLTGMTVVDMTVAIQGPHAGAYLADMGADVVKVERPGGELNRYVRTPGFLPTEGMGTQYVAMNRGKRGIALDVHSDLGREVLHRLVARADVFLTNYRREALERMRLGYAELAALNPRLVYARVSGFGPLGPDADKAMLDGAAQARSGVAAISGAPDGPPMPPGAAIADHTGRHAAGARRDDRALRPGAHRARPGGEHVVARGDDVGRKPGRSRSPAMATEPMHPSRASTTRTSCAPTASTRRATAERSCSSWR